MVFGPRFEEGTFRTPVGRDSSVNIQRDYGLDGRDSITYRPALGHTKPPIQCVPGGSFPGGKAAGA
jgi:hypothetical protein